MNLDPGTRLGRYEIQNHLGTGGMGEVYRALDTELHRAVALKFLRSEVAADEKRMQRFIQEARSASALNHPNILTVYEIGQADGARFFSTEFIDGLTLRTALAARQMKLIEVLDVAIQVASALAAAHAAGIIHRDIKPENIMLRRDGYMKVLDFGLAKTVDRTSSTIVTITREQSSKIWLASPSEEEARAKRLTSGKHDGQWGLDITPDGRVVYITQTGDNTDLWIMNADGTGQKQLTSNDEFENAVRVSADGRYIVFASTPAGSIPHIWRMDTDGGNLKQLTRGDFADYNPFCSLDNQWVVFSSWRSGKPRVWKVPIDGGEPVQLNDLPFEGGLLLPDGKQIFGQYFDEQVSPPRWRAALASFENGQIVKVFDFPLRAQNWKMSDERTLLYVEERDGVSNIWTRPMEGGAPQQLTNFASEQIFLYAPSSDGKQFAVARGTLAADIILIKDFR